MSNFVEPVDAERKPNYVNLTDLACLFLKHHDLEEANLLIREWLLDSRNLGFFMNWNALNNEAYRENNYSFKFDATTSETRFAEGLANWLSLTKSDGMVVSLKQDKLGVSLDVYSNNIYKVFADVQIAMNFVSYLVPLFGLYQSRQLVNSNDINDLVFCMKLCVSLAKK